MKYHLLIAGYNYYPQADTGDWIKTFNTREEAEATIIQERHYRTSLKGKNKGEQEQTHSSYIIDGTTYDWYEIIDLREWLEKE